MGYQAVSKLAADGYLMGNPFFFNQKMGHCMAHCCRWVGTLMEAGDPGQYWQSLIDNGATPTQVRLNTGLTGFRVAVGSQGDDIIGDHQAILMSGDRSAGAIAEYVVPMFKACMNKTVRSKCIGANDHVVNSYLGGVKGWIDSMSDRLFDLNVMRISAIRSGPMTTFSMDLTRGNIPTNHVVASVSMNDLYFFFDPNWGQFVVRDDNRSRLIDAWWSDTAQQYDYSSYNAVDIIASTV